MKRLGFCGRRVWHLTDPTRPEPPGGIGIFGFSRAGVEMGHVFFVPRSTRLRTQTCSAYIYAGHEKSYMHGIQRRFNSVLCRLIRTKGLRPCSMPGANVFLPPALLTHVAGQLSSAQLSSAQQPIHPSVRPSKSIYAWSSGKTINGNRAHQAPLSSPNTQACRLVRIFRIQEHGCDGRD